MAETAAAATVTVPAATAAVIPPESKANDAGNHVAILQRYLRAWGFDPGGITGTFDECTTAAVSALQRALGVAVTGAYDAVTQEAIRADLRSGSASVLLSPASSLVPPPAIVDGGAAHRPQRAVEVAHEGGLQRLLSSRALWILAGGAALYFLTRSRPAIEIDGVEEISGGSDDDDEEEEEEDAVLEAPAKTKARRPHRKKSSAQFHAAAG